MKFLPIAVLMLAAFGAEAVVDVPSEAPSESEVPFSSEAPFSTTPVEFDASSTFYPDDGNCRQYPKDTHTYITWKLNKTFGDDNCETSADTETGGVNIACSVEVEGWFQASAQYTAIPQTKTKEDNPNFPNPNYGSDLLIDLPDLEPGSLVLQDTNAFGDSFQESLDFETNCMDAIKDALRIIETKRENPENAPISSDFPNASPIDKSDYPVSVSEYPSFGETSLYPSYFPQGNACPDTHEQILQALYDTFGEDNCELTTNRQERDFVYKEMTCTYNNPTFESLAGYVWALRDGNDIAADLYVSSGTSEASSAYYIDWTCADPGDIGPNGTCLETYETQRFKRIREERLKHEVSEFPHASPISEYPSIGEASFYPSYFPQGNACPDKHEDIIQALDDTFGEENCKLTTNRQERDFVYKEISCSYNNPTFEGVAGYTWALRDGNDIPVDVYVRSGDSEYYIDWTCVDPGDIGPNGTCLETYEAQGFKRIKEERLKSEVSDFPHESPIDKSQYPSLGETSLYPSYFPQGNACPDKHEDVLKTLYDSFGEENCKLTTDRQERDFVYKVMTCEYTNPTWFRGEAGYTWALRDGKNIGVELYVEESEKYGTTDTHWLDWQCVDSGDIGPNGTCLETVSKLKSIKEKRLNPQDGPQCDNQEKIIFYGRKMKKQITCDAIAELPHKKRNKLCSKHKPISDACPGVCQVDPDCKCINNYKEFHSGASKGKKKFFTCERLRKMTDNKKKQKRCSKPTYQANCPSICLVECQETF